MMMATKWMRMQWWTICLLAGYLAVFYWQLAGYVNYRSLDFQLGVLALLVIATSTQNKKQGGVRFAIAALLMCAITILLPVKTMLYVTLLLSVFFVVESRVGKMSVLSLLVVLMVSPVCKYAMNVFSFPVRLWLTQRVGTLLSFTGHDVLVEGNIVFYKGNEFSVDPACMGLYMLITSLLSGIMIMTLQQKKYRLQLSAGYMMWLLLFIVSCNLLCNICRIFILVYYNIPPEALWHDVVGMVCFIVYVIVPALWFCGWMIRKYGSSNKNGKSSQDQFNTSKSKWLHLAVFLCSAIAAVVIAQQKKNDNTAAVVESAGLYKTSVLENNITKLENESALIYIKLIAGFYSSDHHPMICWAGSGYEFTKVHAVQMSGREVYAGVLSKGQEQLYTAWWYDNGQHHTIQQWRWRWNMVKGSKAYSLINITAASSDELTKQVTQLIQHNPITNTHKF